MSAPILASKLYIPLPQPQLVLRPASFGKTTLVSEWFASWERPTARLSLDEEDGDPARFLIFLVTVLQTIAPNLGAGVLSAIQSIQSPPTEAIMWVLQGRLDEALGRTVCNSGRSI